MNHDPTSSMCSVDYHFAQSPPTTSLNSANFVNGEGLKTDESQEKTNGQASLSRSVTNESDKTKDILKEADAVIVQEAETPPDAVNPQDVGLPGQTVAPPDDDAGRRSSVDVCPNGGVIRLRDAAQATAVIEPLGRSRRRSVIRRASMPMAVPYRANLTGVSEGK